MDDAQRVISDLLTRYTAEPEFMPADWAHADECDHPAPRSRRIADFIAGMTDRYAYGYYKRLFQPDAGSFYEFV